LTNIEEQATPSAADLVALAVACRKRDDLDGAANAAARALERDPQKFDALLIAAWVAVRQGDAEKAILCYRRLAELAPNTPRLPFEIIRLLVYSGNLKEGSNELTAALRRWPNEPSLRALALMFGFRSPKQLAPMTGPNTGYDVGLWHEQQLQRLVEIAPRDSELLRPIIADDKLSDVIFAEAPNTDIAVLVFTSAVDLMAMPLPIFDRYLAALGVTTIYVKDFQRLAYLNGIGSLGQDYGATVAALRKICRKMAVRSVCTVGDSAGGAAAVRYGIELGADRLVSFCGQTHLVRGPMAKLEQGLAMIQRRLESRLSAENLDLRRFLLAHRHSSSIEWIYSEKVERDKTHALHLSGINGVTLHPVAECNDHMTLLWLALHGQLRALLEKLLGLRPSE
jgi:tetratricopeptide (TPR) repeat protein